MGTFSNDLAKFAEKVKHNADEVVGDVVVQAAQALDRRSPVGDAKFWKSPPPKGYVGGRFRGNWQLGVDTVPTGETGRIDRAGTTTQGEIIALIPEEASGKLYTLINNVPYGEAIELGHSHQAPYGVVGLTEIELPDMVDQAVARLAK